MKILIAVPAFNEEQDIVECLKTLTVITEKNKFDICVINDGSTDKTEELVSKFKNVVILKSRTNFGLAQVFNSILSYAIKESYDYLVIFDADMQYPAEELKNLTSKAFGSNADICIGIRNFKDNKIFSKYKNMLQLLGSFIVSLVLGKKLSDVTSGFRVYSQRAMESLLIRNNFSYTIESLFQAQKFNLNIEEYSLNKFNRTRESRLFKSNFDYIVKTLKILFNTILIYKKNLIFYLYSLSVIPGVILISRFFLNYIKFGSNTGNVQSLIVGIGYFLFLTLLYMLTLIWSFNMTQTYIVYRNTFRPSHK